MKKKSRILSILTAGIVAGTVTFAGCSLVTANAQSDMNQVIAEIDISKSEKLDEDLKEYTGAISGGTEIIKRQLVAYFLNAGSSLVSGGSTYGEAFETLANTLVNNEILIQYATLATLQDMVEDGYDGLTSASAAVSWFNDESKTDIEKYAAMIDYQATVDDYTGDKDVDYNLLAEYSLKASLNSAIDSYEELILETDTTEDTSDATLPEGVDTEVENFYPLKEDGTLDYNVYTGYSDYTLPLSGIYQEDKLEGTTSWKRRQAYNRFIQRLDANYLITDDDDISDIWNLDYVQGQYLSLLRQQLLLNYYNLYELELEKDIEENSIDYVEDRYEELLGQQKADYNGSVSSYESSLSSLSDTSFILYTPNTDNGRSFGYVYNILLPFSTSQSNLLTSLTSLLNNNVITQNEYYEMRNKLLGEITTTDQRSAWFNGGVDYSFNANDNGFTAGAAATADGKTYYNAGDDSRKVLFFKDNMLGNKRYENLEKYPGLYSYNGTAVKNGDDSYTLIPNSLDIDEMLDEFIGYIDFTLGTENGSNVTWSYWADGETINVSDTSKGNPDYYLTDIFNTDPADEKSEIDYSKFVYAYGTVDLGDFTTACLLDENSDYYKVMSAVNELQYAYTTDTGILSNYIGYSISAYSTDYIKEFEYAAQYAINNNGGNAGAFAVCAGDYGWHLIYVTNVFNPDSETYTPAWSANIKTEGTFEYEFYEAIKNSDLENASSRLQLELLDIFDNDVVVTVYESRFSDLTSLTTTANTGSTTTDGTTSGTTTTA